MAYVMRHIRYHCSSCLSHAVGISFVAGNDAFFFKKNTKKSPKFPQRSFSYFSFSINFEGVVVHPLLYACQPLLLTSLKAWEKREAGWRKEQEAREKLLKEVLMERSKQLAQKCVPCDSL